MPLLKPGRDHSNDNLSGQGGLSVFLQHHLPVMAAMREDCVGSHTHPRGILSDADRVASVADVGLWVMLVRVPQETWVHFQSLSISDVYRIYE